MLIPREAYRRGSGIPAEASELFRRLADRRRVRGLRRAGRLSQVRLELSRQDRLVRVNFEDSQSITREACLHFFVESARRHICDLGNPDAWTDLPRVVILERCRHVLGRKVLGGGDDEEKIFFHPAWGMQTARRRAGRQAFHPI